MAKKLKEGDSIYVPWARLGVTEDKPSALHRTKVISVQQRSVVVEMPEATTVTVASSAVLKSVGIAIIRIGDLETERGLLDPLAKSVLQFCRLLNTDDSFTSAEPRGSDRSRKRYRHSLWYKYEISLRSWPDHRSDPSCEGLPLALLPHGPSVFR